MPTYSYRALNGNGEFVNGAIIAADVFEVGARLEQLGLVLVDEITIERPGWAEKIQALFGQPTPENITVFTQELATLLRAGTRIHDALEFLTRAGEQRKMLEVIDGLRARVVAGDGFGEALARRPDLFPPTYLALVRVGEASGSLDRILEGLAAERQRVEALRRKLADALRYPAFVLFAAGCVLTFFLTFVLPQFAGVLQGFGAKIDPLLSVFFRISEFLRANTTVIAAVLLIAVAGGWFVFRQPEMRQLFFRRSTSLPLIRPIVRLYLTSIFCRNLSILLGSGVNLTLTLRILVEMMESLSSSEVWRHVADLVRRGAKLSDALAQSNALPELAVGMLRLGDETGQMAVLAGRVAEFYENRLQRTLDRIVGMVGPAAIILISVVVGGLITSVMTALLSVSQVIG